MPPTPGQQCFTDTPEFRSAVNRHVNVNDGIAGRVNYAGTRRAETDHVAWNRISGSRHTFQWEANAGWVLTERNVQFYDMGSVAFHEDCTPKAFNDDMRKLCNVEASMSADGRDGFDRNLFWSAVVLFDAVGTTGVHGWDEALKRMGMKMGGRIADFRGDDEEGFVRGGGGGGGGGIVGRLPHANDVDARGVDGGGGGGSCGGGGEGGGHLRAAGSVSPAAAGGSAGGNGCRRGNTLIRGREAPLAAAGGAAVIEKQDLLARTLEVVSKQLNNMEKRAELLARIAQKESEVAARRAKGGVKRQQSSDDTGNSGGGNGGGNSGGGGGGGGGGDFGDIGEYYRGAKEQQKRARVEVGSSTLTHHSYKAAFTRH